MQVRKSFCNTSLALEASIGATGRATILAGLLLSLMNNGTGSIARLAGQNRLPEVSRPMLFVGTIFLTCLTMYHWSPTSYGHV